MLTTPQIDPIQSSFAAAMANRDDLITDFYRSLFAREPALRGMFSSDITAQSKMLASALHMAVRKLDDLETLIEPLHVLGAKHAGYGATPAHYALVTEVLIDCLERAVGPKWTDAHAQAWMYALILIARTMVEGAKQARSEAEHTSSPNA